MMEQTAAQASPRLTARIAGVFYLLTILTGGFALFVGGRLVVPGDAAATATNILTHEPLLLLGFAADVISTACYIAVTALFYSLFQPVNRIFALVATLFGVAGCSIVAAGCLFELIPLVVSGGAQYSRVFTVEPVQALAFIFYKLHARCFNIGLIFFGFHCLLTACLIFRSKFLAFARLRLRIHETLREIGVN
ncbi:MAG: DUF4386 domain-containing protein [Acidobacteriota bacterium]|nr:DUF4386 domain-containing protein [Acidobacteriota bacterium]